MTPQELDWRSDWPTFVRSVGHAYDRGLDDAAVNALYCDVAIRWVGRIADYFYDDAVVWGVKMHMPPTRIDLVDGRYAIVDYLCLRPTDDDAASWKPALIGTEVRFETFIKKGYSLFPGIRWSGLDESDRFGAVMIGTKDSRLLETIASPNRGAQGLVARLFSWFRLPS